MMPRYLLAKYVPELSRMEPRNIGVILWSKGAVVARFLRQDQATFVNDIENYEAWLQSWEKAISGATISPRRGKPVPTKDASCMDALLTQQEGNYVLVDAGEILRDVPKRDIGNAADFLFNQLVALKPTKGERHKVASENLRQRCRSLFESTKIAYMEGFHDGYKMACDEHTPGKGVRLK